MPALTIVPTADDLSLRSAVIGDDGLVLNVQDGVTTLHSVTSGKATLLGEFTDPRDAWMLIDRLDDEAAGYVRAAA